MCMRLAGSVAAGGPGVLTSPLCPDLLSDQRGAGFFPKWILCEMLVCLEKTVSR